MYWSKREGMDEEERWFYDQGYQDGLKAAEKRGEWLPYEFGDYHWHKCSVCGKADKYIETVIRENALGITILGRYDLESDRKYCPNCGAIMDVPDNDVEEMERSEE